MHYSIQDFIQLIAQLRNPNGGCPWDLKQNYESMIPCLSEENYEVNDALQKKEIVKFKEELGALFFKESRKALSRERVEFAGSAGI